MVKNGELSLYCQDVHSTFIEHSTGSPRHSNQKRKIITCFHIGKEIVKLSVFADNMILYIENPKDSIKKLLELINKFNKWENYKINSQKLVEFLYTNNKVAGREI